MCRARLGHCDAAHAHAWRAKMVMGVHTEKDPELVLHAIATLFSDILGELSARAS